MKITFGKENYLPPMFKVESIINETGFAASAPGLESPIEDSEEPW